MRSPRIQATAAPAQATHSRADLQLTLELNKILDLPQSEPAAEGFGRAHPRRKASSLLGQTVAGLSSAQRAN